MRRTGRKFISPIEPLALKWLSLIEFSDEESNRTKLRAQALRLSNSGYSISQISQICLTTQETVSKWIDGWEKYQFDSLIDKKKLRWCRGRKSLKSKRNENEFREAQKEIEILKDEDQANIIDLYYFDESGFTGVPEIPYAWQDEDEQLLLPSGKTSRINVLGFLNKQNDFFPCVFDCSVTSDIVTACFDAFSRYITKRTIVVLDNAPIHHSAIFKSQIGTWEERGLFLYFIPKYSPELNLIEILWKHIKYFWLSTSAYKGFEFLKTELNNILASVGKEFTISFS
ncbi:IS630 family transposase [Desulfobacter postgatei]|uniref:Transposase n=1 Tax=Desulfobacter postgatei 2ac9 TaxID=879212 RepID=I5B182_9BACT|nr:IS630 family transposase [Desulfobacter postgatei]EIM63245.1 transposase [Desulfobacter postgatei 2ac9]